MRWLWVTPLNAPPSEWGEVRKSYEAALPAAVCAALEKYRGAYILCYMKVRLCRKMRLTVRRISEVSMKKTTEKTEYKETVEIDGHKVRIGYGTDKKPELIKAMRDILTEQLAVNKNE